MKNEQPVMVKRLYNLKEASTYLGRSVWAVREMLWAGKLPYVKDGRRILIDIRDMDEWIDKNKARSRNEYVTDKKNKAEKWGHG